MVAAVPDLARRMMLAKHAWLRPSMCEPNAAGEKAGVHTLHFHAKLVFPDGSTYEPDVTYHLTVS